MEPITDLAQVGSNLSAENQQGFSGLVAPIETAPQESFNTMDWVDSVWQTGNSVRAGLGYYGSITDNEHIPDVPEENMFQSLKPYAGYLDRFEGVTSAREVQQIKTRIDNEMLNGRVMSTHGFWSNLLMTVPAALGDPLNLIGLGEAAAIPKAINAVRIAEAGAQATRFAAGAARIAAEMTPSTLAIYASTETQTPADLALNYSLGLGLAGMIHSIPHIRARMDANGVTLDDTAVAATHMINTEKSMGAAMSRSGSGSGIDIQIEGRTNEQLLADMEVVGEKYIKRTGQQWIDPLFRAQTSVGSGTARAAAAALNDSHLMTKEMLPTVDENGQITDWGREKQVSVQAIARSFIGAHESAVTDMKGLYQAYRVSKGASAPNSHVVTVVGDFVTRPQGLLTIDEFSERVGKALRNSDTAIKSNDALADKYVTESAKAFRTKVYNPIFERAQYAGLVDDDITLSTASSYLNRIYDVDAIVANRAGFSQKISNYLAGKQNEVREFYPKLVDELKKLYDTESGLNEKIKANDAEIQKINEKNMMVTASVAKLRTDPEKLASDIAQVEQQIKLADYAQKKTSKTLQSQKVAIDKAEQNLIDTQKATDEFIKTSPDSALLDAGVDKALREMASEENPHWWNKDLGQTDEIIAALDRFQAGKKVSAKLMQQLNDRVGIAEDLKYTEYHPNESTPAPNVMAKIEKARAEVKAARAKHAEIVGKEDSGVKQSRIAMEHELTKLKTMQEVIDRQGLAKKLAKENEIHINHIRKISRQILVKHESKDVAENLMEGNIQKLTDEIFHKITKTGGRISSGFDDGIGARGAALDRTLGIQDVELEDFLINDARHASEQYARTFGTDVAITEKFGDPKMETTLNKVKAEYQEKMSGLSGDALQKMNKEMNQVIKSLEGNRDRLRGMYEMPDRDKWWSDLMHRSAFFVKSLNTLRLMGGTLVASLGDPMNMIMTYGVKSFLNDGLVPLVKSMNSMKVANMSAEELKLGGTALEIERSGMWGAINEVWDGAGSDTAAERALKSGVRVFGYVSLVSPWNQMMKRTAGTLVQNNVLRSIMKYDSLTPVEVRNLNQIGIGKDKALRIKAQLDRLDSEGHILDQSGVMVAMSKKWDDAQLQEHYRAAIASEVDRIHVTPGGEKPLFMSTGMGSVIMQFKSFILSSHHRIILAGLQRHDANFLSGIVGLTGMGMLIYKLKKGDKTSDDPEVWVREGLDRGGVFGWFMEANNMVSGATGGAADVFRVIGAEKPVSRYQTRGAFGSLFGPSFGAGQDSYGIIRDIANGEVDASTMHKSRSLLPFQNLFYAKGVLDTAEENISAYFGGLN